MAPTLVLTDHAARKRLAEKAARVMQLLDNDADDSDLNPRAITTGPSRRVPVAAQVSSRQQLLSHRRGAPRLSLQLSEGYECCKVPTPNHHVRRVSSSSFGTSSSDSPRSPASCRSSGSASTGSPNGFQSRGHASRVDTLGPNHGRHVSTPVPLASASALESPQPSSVRRSSSSSSGVSAGHSTKAIRQVENHHHQRAADSTPHNAGATTPSAAARAPPRSRPGLKSSSLGSAATSNVPRSRRPQHYDTWHGDSLDRVPIPTRMAHTVESPVGARASHHFSPRESPRKQLHCAAAEGPGGQRAEPYGPHPSPRSSGGTAAVHGAPKSRSDPDFAAVDTRPVLHAPQRQLSSDLGARGPARTLSGQIRRAPDDDDDVGKPFVTRNHHASPVDHSRQRCDGRGPAVSGGSYDDFPACSTVGRGERAERVERGRRRAAAQACSPFDPSSSPTSPSAASPRFPCSIPSPRHNPVTSPAAYQQSPRQLPASSSVGCDSPGQRARGQRRSGDGRVRRSQQLSPFDSWDDSEPIYDDGDPMLQSSPSPRSQRGFSSRQHAAFQSDSEEEEDCRDANGDETRRPLSRWRSHSLAEDPIEENTAARRVHTLDRRPAPSQSLPDCRLPRRSCDERSMRHTCRGSHGGACVDVQRAGEVGENAGWVDKDSLEGEGEDVEAVRERQRNVEEAGMERRGNERHGPTLKKMQGGLDLYQSREAVCDLSEDSKQQSRPAGRNEGHTPCGDAASGGVMGCESREAPKSKPKSKLQRSLSDDDEEEERAEKEVRTREEARAKVLKQRRDAICIVKQSGKKVLPRKVSK